MKFMEKLKKKNNNKGFSLVELIIVIAIMAILVGIVGTQVVPYIEKSRKAKDIQKVSALCTDAMTAFSSNAAKLDASATYTITMDGSGVTIDTTSTATNTGETEMLNSFKELNKYTCVNPTTTTANALTFESASAQKISSITIKCQNDSPMVEVTVITTGSDAADYNIKSN